MAPDDLIVKPKWSHLSGPASSAGERHGATYPRSLANGHRRGGAIVGGQQS
jgi:hypothetical protein